MDEDDKHSLIPQIAGLKSDTGFSESYVRNTTMRAGVNLIPYVGGTIDVLLAGKAERLQESRIQSLISAFTEEMSDIEARFVNKVYFETEEGIDLLVEAIERAKKTRNANKIQLYAKILRGATTIGPGEMSPRPEEYIAVLSELSPRELAVAKIIFEYQRDEYLGEDGINELQWASQTWGEIRREAQSVVGMELDFILQRISGVGLIREITGGFLDYTGGTFVVTKTFRALMCFVGSDWPDFGVANTK